METKQSDLILLLCEFNENSTAVTARTTLLICSHLRSRQCADLREEDGNY
jgi:hypothetical protein